MFTRNDKRRPSRAVLENEIRILKNALVEAEADLMRVTRDRDRNAERADLFVGIATECAQRANAIAAESDYLAAEAARALPQLGEVIFAVHPWGEAPIYESLTAAETRGTLVEVSL